MNIRMTIAAIFAAIMFASSVWTVNMAMTPRPYHPKDQFNWVWTGR